MNKPKVVFSVLTVLFGLLDSLMLLMFFAELQAEEDSLARVLDIDILGLGVVFMLLQAAMAAMLWKGGFRAQLRKLFLVGLVVWFNLEVVLSYLWCFVTGADPLLEHTPFVVVFALFNGGQFWALRSLGILSLRVDRQPEPCRPLCRLSHPVLLWLGLPRHRVVLGPPGRERPPTVPRFRSPSEARCAVLALCLLFTLRRARRTLGRRAAVRRARALEPWVFPGCPRKRRSREGSGFAAPGPWWLA